MQEKFLTVSEVARRQAVAPRVISDLFYARRLDDRRCPVIGGRRLIPADYIPEIEAVLRGASAATARRQTAIAPEAANAS